jgi:phytoene synthase
MEKIDAVGASVAAKPTSKKHGPTIVSELSTSYAYCQRLARQSASNFYFSFLLLAREKRRAMCALYAYLRHVDDLADDEGHDLATRQKALESLRSALVDQAHAGHKTHPILPALADTVMRYQIPLDYLTAVIDGVEMDLAGRQYETFDELEQYCERVASVVGQACIHIWGFRGEQALEPARRCGVAFQLTNILRDLKEDSQQGRVYLPHEDLRRFGYSVEELRQSKVNPAFTALMEFEIARAESYYQAIGELEPLLERDGRQVFRAMSATYRAMLAKIKQRPEDVFQRRVRLSRWEKLRIAAGAMWGRGERTQANSKWEAVSS